MRLLHVSGFCFVALHATTAFAALDIPLTVTLSESVIVTGTPRMAVDVGGVTRYATYTSGSTTSTLTFTLSPQAGDVDLDGITLVSPLELNGGTMKDAAGNNAALTFTPPNTSGIKVNYPSLSMDFVADADGRYTMNGTVYNDLTSFLAATGGTFTRATVGTYFDSAGVLQTASAGTPRFEYDPITHTPKGILIEESRTNIATYSSQLETATVLTGTSVSPNVVLAPDGTLTADKITEDTSSAAHQFQKFPSYGNLTTYQQSIFLKAAERSKVMVFAIGLGNTAGQQGYFDLSTGTMTSGTGSITSVGNGWYKITVLMTTGNPSTSPGLRITLRDASGASSYTGDGTSGIYIWGMQVEAGAFPTSYIPTTSATATRAADGLQIPTGSWYSSASGTAATQGITLPTTSTGFPRIWAIDNGSTTSYDVLINGNMSNRYEFGVNSSTLEATTLLHSNPSSSAAGYSTTGEKLAVNGVLSSGSASSIPLYSVNILRLGNRADGTRSLNGSIKNFKYYPIKVSDAQLQLLTQ